MKGGEMGSHPSVCFVMPTRNRSDDLAFTLAELGRLPRIDAEVLIVDNASDEPPRVPMFLPNGLPVRVHRRPTNEGASARNHAIGRTDADWVVMLDDDSSPTTAGFLDALSQADGGVLAVSADIHLPRSGAREMGGLPEVFIGCGVAFRRAALEDIGGYDPAFGYYAEEYDLSARMLLAGGEVRFDPRFRVDHRKSPGGRDMNLIVERLVRNNGWVMQRYAPALARRAQIREIRRRTRFIATKEGAVAGYARGLSELRCTVAAQRRTPMSAALFERFTGLAHARAALHAAFAGRPFRTASLVEPGKNAWCVERALVDLGVRLVDPERADRLVIGTMSPGPMIDAMQRRAFTDRRVIAPWTPAADMVDEPVLRASA
jgi:GT2 family glycosyltransferase